MRRLFNTKIFLILYKLFTHGNLEGIEPLYDLYNEPKKNSDYIEQEENTKDGDPNNNDHHVFTNEPPYKNDKNDETAQMIRQTLKDIQDFRDITNELNDLSYINND